MSRLAFGLATAALLSAPLAAQAQNFNVVRDSGNGANNTIVARNGPAIQLRSPGAPVAFQPQFPTQPVDYQPGYPAGPSYQPGYPTGPSYQPGYAPVFADSPGYGSYPAAGFGPAGPVYQKNVITGSGNGVNNTIVARNRGGFSAGGYGYPASAGYGYDPSAPFPYGMGGFGVNVNVITNSGNGAGNTVNTFNKSYGGPGGVNINVITNSGNGVNNTIGARNR